MELLKTRFLDPMENPSESWDFLYLKLNIIYIPNNTIIILVSLLFFDFSSGIGKLIKIIFM